MAKRSMDGSEATGLVATMRSPAPDLGPRSPA